ncbi:MAG: polyphenol oxidase family protein [Acidimicrobiales bacterium]
MIERVHAGGLALWHFAFDGPHLLAAVTTRHGGCSAGPYTSLNLATHVGDDPDTVARNRERLRAVLGVERLSIADQRHGRDIAVVDGSGEDPGAVDILLTNVPGAAVSILVADCAPVVLHDPVNRAVAAVHAGRKGAVLDAPGAAVRAMAATYGTDPADLVGGIGPCIGAANYEIGGDALTETRDAFGDDLLEPTRAGHARFDLPSAVRRRLEHAGVASERIEAAGIDTFTATGPFFSDRAQRPCGRFALVARLSAG